MRYIWLLSFALVFMLCTPVVVSADEFDDLDTLEMAQEFEALAYIEDEEERLDRARDLCWEFYHRALALEGFDLTLGFTQHAVNRLSDNSEVVNLAGLGVTGTSVVMSSAYPEAQLTKHLDSLNNFMTDLGGLLVTYQFAQLVYSGDAVMEHDSWVYAKNMMIYYMNRYPWNANMAAFAFGVATFDYVLNKILQSTVDAYNDAWFEVYEWFYLEGPGKQSMDQWADHFSQPQDIVKDAQVYDSAPGSYADYLNAFWDNPERFIIPGSGSPVSTMEIFEYYQQNILQSSTRLISRDVLANAVMKDAFRNEFMKRHLVKQVRPILENRRDLFYGEIYNQIDRLESEIAFTLRLLENRKDYTVVTLNSATGDPIPNINVEFKTMTESGSFVTNGSGEATINVPEFAPKIIFKSTKDGFKESVEEFYTHEDFGPRYMLHLEPTARHGLTLRILDERTQRPIPDARVFYAFEGRTDRKETAADGYIWRDFPNGMLVEVTAGADGYYPLQNIAIQLHEDPVSRTIELQPVEGAAVANLRVKVMSRYDDGPVPDATVKITSSGHSDSQKTDYQGFVTLKAAPDVLSTIQVSADQYVAASDQIKVSAISPETIVWLNRGSRNSVPTNLSLKLEDNSNKVPINEELNFEYSYNILENKKHDVKISVKAPDGSDHSSKYLTDVIASNGAVSGSVRLDPPISPGTYQARLMVRYGGQVQQSEVLKFTAEWPDVPGVIITGDSGDQNKLRRFEKGLASISPEPSTQVDIERVDWFLITPDGRRFPSRENNTDRTKGRAGLSNDLMMAARATLGKYGVEAEIVTSVGSMKSAGGFELLPPEEVPSDSEFSNIRVSFGNELVTGEAVPMTLSGQSFEISELEENSVRGLGQYKGQFYLDHARGVIYFRPYLSGNQTAMFSIEYDGKEIPVKFDCRPNLNLIHARPEDVSVSSGGDVEVMIRASGSFVPPFNIRRQSPRNTFQVGPYGEKPNQVLGKFTLNIANIDEVPQMDIKDSEGAEARVDFSKAIKELRPQIRNGRLGVISEVTLQGFNQLGSIKMDSIYHSPNLEVKRNGSRPIVKIVTGERDMRRQLIHAVFVGSNGIGFVNDFIQMEPFEGEEVADADCKPPRNIQTLLDRMKKVSGSNSPFTSAINQQNYDQLNALSNSYFTDSTRVFNWMAGLRNCDLLTNADRKYFSDTADVMLIMQDFSNPQNIDPQKIQELTGKIQRMQGQSSAVERRLRANGFYELVFE